MSIVASCTLLPPREGPARGCPTLVGSRLQWCSEHGSKIDEIIKLGQSIVGEKKEKVLIFAQWSESIDKLEEALVAAKVPFSVFKKQ